MMRLYSKGCEYAIKAFLYLAAHADESRMTAEKVCRKARIPEAYTRKVFQSLVKGRYLKAVPGKGGGYRLCRKPEDVSLLEIIKAVDGKRRYNHCIMGSPKCGDSRPCLLHQTWAASKDKILHKLSSKRITDVTRLY